MKAPLSLSLAFLSLACTGSDELPGSSADVSGVEVVANDPPYPTRTIADSPEVRIGAVQGSPDQQFASVAFAAGLSDGRIVVADAGSSDVRWFGPEGDLLTRAGGRGEGPGEFLALVAGVLLSGDTLALFDARNQRITWLAPDGSLARTRRLELTSAFAVTLGDAGAGQLFVAEERATHNFGGAEYNYARDSLLLMLPSNSGQDVDTISRLPGREAATWVDYVDGRPAGSRQMDLPLGEIALAQALPGGWVVVEPGSSDVAFYSLDGSVTRVARRSDVQHEEVRPDIRRRFIDAVVEGVDEGGPPVATLRASLDARFALAPEGRTVPAFDQLLVDSERSEIWVREFAGPWSLDEDRRWTIYDRGGRVVAQVEVPRSLRPTHVGAGKIVAVETDGLGVEYVVRYSIR